MPMGFFDTPLSGATVTGSIAVTGWALDQDGAVDRVEIWRDLAPGEPSSVAFNSPGHPGHGKVFIANATFIRGARPDIVTLYPSYPNNDRAGWGYLLLTQGLFNGGNGAFTLYAFAWDVDGQATTLGTKSITANNAQATRPFGALDTPSYGTTVSGGMWNYGWALTPNPNTTDPRSCVITDGNVYVGLDSAPIVAVDYGATRLDIEIAFPGFSNGTTAGGSFYIDTTALGNGDHQIGWYVVDNCGRADGIGSRFFSVLNGVNIRTEADAGSLVAPASRPAGAAESYDESLLLVRFDQTSRSEPSNDGAHVIRIAQRQRIEVELPPRLAGARPGQAQDGVSGFSRTSDSAAYRGAEIVNGVEKPLPLGSSLDIERGIFYWEPAPAFLGTYELIFAAGDRPPVRVRVVVGP